MSELFLLIVTLRGEGYDIKPFNLYREILERYYIRDVKGGGGSGLSVIILVNSLVCGCGKLIVSQATPSLSGEGLVRQFILTAN
jgi:hypothetical protein